MFYWYFYEDKIIDVVKQQVVQIDVEMLFICVYVWGDLMWVKGVVVYVIDQVLVFKVWEFLCNVD